MVPYSRGEPTGLCPFLPEAIYASLDAISDLCTHHVVVVHQLVLDCFDHANPGPVRLIRVMPNSELMIAL
jgi:hypothetical protein